MHAVHKFQYLHFLTIYLGISRNFRNARQEDAHEYMVNLLESMHKCCLPSGVPSESPAAYEKSLVHKIFGGRLRSQVIFSCLVVKCWQYYRNDSHLWKVLEYIHAFLYLCVQDIELSSKKWFDILCA